MEANRYFSGTLVEKQANKKPKKSRPVYHCPLCGRVGNYTMKNVLFCSECLVYFDKAGHTLAPDEEGEIVPKIKHGILIVQEIELTLVES